MKQEELIMIPVYVFALCLGNIFKKTNLKLSFGYLDKTLRMLTNNRSIFATFKHSGYAFGSQVGCSFYPGSMLFIILQF